MFRFVDGFRVFKERTNIAHLTNKVGTKLFKEVWVRPATCVLVVSGAVFLSEDESKNSVATVEWFRNPKDRPGCSPGADG